MSRFLVPLFGKEHSVSHWYVRFLCCAVFSAVRNTAFLTVYVRFVLYLSKLVIVTLVPKYILYVYCIYRYIPFVSQPLSPLVFVHILLSHLQLDFSLLKGPGPLDPAYIRGVYCQNTVFRRFTAGAWHCR